MRHGNRVDDSYLYDEDALAIGVDLFGKRVCSGCGLTLPACTDYFTPNKNGNGEPSLRTTCRRCRREQLRDGERVRAQGRRDRARVEA